MNRFRSPKQKTNINLKKALRYYAAFSPEFVEDAITLLNLKTEEIILDPWNGSGTTTAIATQLGIKSFGYDLNPAVKMIAEARLASREDVLFAIDFLGNCLGKNCKSNTNSNLPAFNYWLSNTGISYLSKLKGSIVSIESSVIQSVISVAIVSAIREQLNNFKSKNPSWIRVARYESEIIDLEIEKFQKDAIAKLYQLKESRLQNKNGKGLKAVLDIADTKNLPLENGSIDAVITSPPYCTRIDYAIATLVELAWLGMDADQIKNLRSNLIGTPTIKSSKLSLIPELPDSVESLLYNIKNHSSKASATYYYKTFSQFFIDMQLAFKELHRVIRDKGQLCLVVQDSYYKEIPIHLPLLFQDMLRTEGFELIDSHLYPAGGLNLIHGHKSINEVALTCRKIS